MRRIREGLTYSNVMATLAVFIALGGGAYALSRGAVKSKHIARDAVKAKHIDFGVRSTPMLATFNGLHIGTGNANYAPLGASMPTSNEALAPQTFVATGLRIKLDDEVVSGSREFIFAVFEESPGSDYTNLRCTVNIGEQTCRSNARVRVPAGSSVWFEAVSTGTSQGSYAEAGWRAVLP